jgi:hypothetical protein
MDWVLRVVLVAVLAALVVAWVRGREESDRVVDVQARDAIDALEARVDGLGHRLRSLGATVAALEQRVDDLERRARGRPSPPTGR